MGGDHMTYDYHTSILDNGVALIAAIMEIAPTADVAKLTKAALRAGNSRLYPMLSTDELLAEVSSTSRLS